MSYRVGLACLLCLSAACESPPSTISETGAAAETSAALSLESKEAASHASTFLYALRRLHSLHETPLLDHIVRVGADHDDTWLIQASTATRRYLAIFESDLASAAGGFMFMPGRRCAVSASFERYDRLTMQPAPPQIADLDGDGKPEVLCCFSTRLADRDTRTALICTEQSGQWTIVRHPSVLGCLRDTLPDPGQVQSVHQDDKLCFVEFDEKIVVLQGYSNGGGWRLVPRPNHAGAYLLGMAVEVDASLVRHAPRLVLAMFRFTGSKFELAQDWNRGAIYVHPSRVNADDLIEVIADRFPRR